MSRGVKVASVGLLALALLIPGNVLVGGQSIRDCDQAPSVSCSGYSSLNIRVTSGSCSGQASANCDAVSSAEQSYAEAMADWFGQGRCSSGKADAAAEAVAEAIAEVYTSAFVNVQCDGQGEACGFAISNGAAFAESTAEAAAIAAADAGAGDAFCYADIRAIASVLAAATAQAQADACTTGGTARAVAEAIASEIKTALAEAFALATANSCGGQEEGVSASSKCFGSASSSGFEQLGDVCAGIQQKDTCTGRAATVCCDPSYRSPFCRCDGCGGNLRRVRNNPIRSFAGNDGRECVCPSSNDSAPPSDSCSCTDVQPSQEFSCVEQKSFSKCNEQFMVDGSYCEKTCGRCSCPDGQSPAAPPSPPSEGCSCADVPPSSEFTCSEQESFGKCNAQFMLDGDYCKKTCGRCNCPSNQSTSPPPTPPADCQCNDSKPPTSQFSCQEQRDFGKCNEDWMAGYCQVTCGSCSCPDQQPSGPPSSDCTCSDIQPEGSPYSCAEQRGFGKCQAHWMVDGGFCETTCGRCSCPGSPTAPTLDVESPGEDCTCSDQPPTCANFTCQQQRDWGKCMADWMLVTDKNPDGYCQITCGRCPCSDPKIRSPDTLDYTCSKK